MNRQDEQQESPEQEGITTFQDLAHLPDGSAIRDKESLNAERLATISHELRSPLASIQGYTATLLRHDRRISREERREFLLAIQTASDRLTDVVTALLKLSVFEAGTVALESQSINIVRLVQEAVTEVELRMKRVDMEAQGLMFSQAAHAAPFTVQVQDRSGAFTSADVFVEADQNGLRELIQQLLQNALIHAPTGRTIAITIRPLLSPDDLVRASHTFQEASINNIAQVQRHFPQVVVLGVHDHGNGIAAHHLAQIFEPFYRVDTSLTRETNGLGLGLAISQRIVELHTGRLWAESKPGKGSTFYVCLPQQRHSERKREG